MNKLLVTAFLISISYLAYAQNDTQTEELSKLKKQVNELNVKTQQLTKSMSTYKTILDSLSAQAQSYNGKLNVFQDSLNMKGKIIKNSRGRIMVLFKSLKHRKKLFITWFPIGAVLILGASAFVILRYKSNLSNTELKLLELHRLINGTNDATKNELKAQVAELRTNMQKKFEEVNDRITDQEKRINEIKKS